MFFAFEGCQHNSKVILTSGNNTYENQIIFQNGRIYRQNNKIRIFMNYYNKGISNLADTDIRLAVYLSDDSISSDNNDTINYIKNAAFVLVQTRVTYGFLHVNKIKIKMNIDSTYDLAFYLFGNNRIVTKTGIDSIIISSGSVNLKKANSMKELLNDEIPFDKEIRTNNIKGWPW
jgi:hypothetical protein